MNITIYYKNSNTPNNSLQQTTIKIPHERRYTVPTRCFIPTNSILLYVETMNKQKKRGYIQINDTAIETTELTVLSLSVILRLQQYSIITCTLDSQIEACRFYSLSDIKRILRQWISYLYSSKIGDKDSYSTAISRNVIYKIILYLKLGIYGINNVLYVCDNKKNIMSIAIITYKENPPLKSMFELRDTNLRIDFIATNPSHNREGWGRMLMNDIIDMAKKNKKNKIEVSSIEISKKFYESLGFQHVLSSSNDHYNMYMYL